MFFGNFWVYVRQPQDHICWARSMPFASCNPTNPRTNLWNFHEKFLRIGDFEKWPFLKNGHFGYFFKKKNFFFASFSWKSVQIYMVEWMGWNFDVFPGFQKIPRVVWLYQSWRLCDSNVVHDQQLVLHWIFPPHSYVPTKAYWEYFYFRNKRDLTEIAKPNLAYSYSYFLV